jgi:kynurenine formamidase
MGRPIEKFAPKMNIFTGQVVQVANGVEWQKGTGTKGTSDIKADIVHHNFRFPIPVKIEVKWNKDKQSEDQKQYQQTIESKGGVYVIVKNIDAFFIWFDEFILSL